jgi:hypothetical protein
MKRSIYSSVIFCWSSNSTHSYSWKSGRFCMVGRSFGLKNKFSKSGIHLIFRSIHWGGGI